MPSKARKHFGIDDIISVVGVAIALFGVLVLLSPRTRLRGLAYGLDFLFGLPGYWFIGLGLIVGGVHMLFHRGIKPLKGRVYVGLAILFLSLVFLASGIVYKPELPSTQETFLQILSAANAGGGEGLFLDINLGGGSIGNLIAFPMAESVGKWLPIMLASFVLLSGLLVVFFPLVKKAYRAIAVKIAVARSRRATRKEEEGLLIVGEQEEEKLPKRPMLSSPSKVEEEEGIDKDEDDKFAAFSFEKAGRSPVITRRQLRQAEEPSPVTSEAILTPMPATVSNSAQTQLKHAGLQEAFFDPEELFPGSKPAPTPVQEPIVKPILAGSAPMATPSPARAFEPVLTPPSEPDFGEEMTDYGSIVPQVEPAPVSEPIAKPTPEPVHEPSLQEPSFEPTPEPFVQESVEPVPFEEPMEEEVEEAPAKEPIAPQKPFTPEPPVPKNPEDEIPDEVPLPPYESPGMDLLTVRESEQNMEEMEAECLEKTKIIDQTFVDLGVGATVVGHTIGPSVTRFAIQPRSDVSVATLGRYVKDIEVRLGGVPTRFAERVSGMTSCALEVANRVSRTVSFIELFRALPPRKEGVATLHVPFGVDISGQVKEADLAKFPHMLIAGTTGSGKSIFAHGLLMSLLMRNRPELLKLVLVDPKRVELTKYKDLPHLLCPIIKEPNEARNALKKLVEEMERRFMVFETAGVQNLEEFNNDYCEYAHKKKMPYIVLFIDEYGDLVQTCKDVSDYVLRLGQKARAAGIHMIIATQRPDVKVITGTIKANIPVKVALTVASAVDSQTILGLGGAEDLNGRGDMLIDCIEIAKKEFVRAQGCFCDSHELRAVTDFIRRQLPVDYDPNFLHLEDEEEPSPTPGMEGIAGGDAGPSPQELRNASNEEKYQMIKRAIMAREFTSISQIQRDFGVGFPRAGKIFSRLQSEGIVALASDSPTSSKGCQVLVHELPEDA